jgi:hypothetical protein
MSVLAASKSGARRGARGSELVSVGDATLLCAAPFRGPSRAPPPRAKETRECAQRAGGAHPTCRREYKSGAADASFSLAID